MQKESRVLPDRRKAFKRMGKWILAGAGTLTMGYFALGREGPIDEWVSVGPVSDLPAGEYRSRLVSVTARGNWYSHQVERAIWLRRNLDETVTVLNAMCPHMSYTINVWQKEPGTFRCPGHKSAFDAMGNVLSGPSPRPMDSLEHKVEGGVLMVRYQKFKKNLPVKEVFI